MRSRIAAETPLLRERLVASGTGTGDAAAGFSDLFTAACGPAEGADADGNYRYALEYIYEGYRLHYAGSRLLDPGGDTGFSLLAGDYMYACGLNRVAVLGDLYCIEVLADLIRLCASVHCENKVPSRALDAWALATLCLARHATGQPRGDTDDACWESGGVKATGDQGNGGGAARTGLFATLEGVDAKASAQAVARMLSDYTREDADRLRGILVDIYSSMGMQFGRDI